MTKFMRRIEHLKTLLKQVPAAFYWVLDDGTRIAADGANDPLNFIVYPYIKPLPSVRPTAWKYGGNETDLDPLTKSFLDTALELSLADFPEVKFEPCCEPNIEPTEAYESRKEFLQKQVKKLKESAPNLPSDTAHCI